MHVGEGSVYCMPAAVLGTPHVFFPLQESCEGRTIIPILHLEKNWVSGRLNNLPKIMKLVTNTDIDSQLGTQIVSC